LNIQQTLLYKILKQHKNTIKSTKSKDYIDYYILPVLYFEILLFLEFFEIFQKSKGFISRERVFLTQSLP